MSTPVADVAAEQPTAAPLPTWDDLAQTIGTPATGKSGAGSLVGRFMIPPFSILDARAGLWQDRKKAWLALGLQSEVGRSNKLLFDADREDDVSKRILAAGGGTSVFDPVLCELVYRWWCPAGGAILDPFAGGSVRGIVAARLGRPYTGIDLRPEQVKANIDQCRTILGVEPRREPQDGLPITTVACPALKQRLVTALARPAIAGGSTGLVASGARTSALLPLIAERARSLGLRCQVHVPAGPATPQLDEVAGVEATIVAHEGATLPVVVARARAAAQEAGWAELPYNLECREAVDIAVPLAASIPAEAVRLVVPVRTGLTLAGIVQGLGVQARALPVIGVQLGADPSKRLDRYAPASWRERVTLVPAPPGVTAVAEAVRAVLQPGDCVVVDGDWWDLPPVPTGPVPPGMAAPRWVVGDSLNVATLAPGEYDLVFTCHPATVTVTTADRGPVSIAVIQPGDLVSTHTGATRRVTETLTRQYTGLLYHLKRRYAKTPLQATAEHPLLVARDGDIAWRRAGDLVVGDELLEPVPHQPHQSLDGQEVWTYTAPTRTSRRGRSVNGPRTLRATPALLRFMGYYLAQGSHGPGAVSLAFNLHKTSDHETALADLRELTNGHHTVSWTPSAAGHQVGTVRSSSTVLAQFAATMGSEADTKRFPSWVWECSDELITHLVRCAWHGDGTVCRTTGRLSYTSVSAGLVDDLRRALLRRGIVSSLRWRTARPNEYCATPRRQYELVVRGHYARMLHELMGSTPRQARVRPGRSPYIADGFVHYPITHIDATPVVDLPVYNLEVEHDHSYLADGVVSHNCPPYADLEVYSDDPRDLSTMTYSDFRAIYRSIIASSCALLAENRFAAIVVGEIRGNDGSYRNFVGDTIQAFLDAGLTYYNELILATSVGSLPLRTSFLFEKGRKVGKSHQQLLVFVKGDWRKANEACGAMDADVSAPLPIFELADTRARAKAAAAAIAAAEQPGQLF